MFDASPSPASHALMQDRAFAAALALCGGQPVILPSGLMLLGRRLAGVPVLMLPRAAPPPDLSLQLRQTGLQRRPPHPVTRAAAVRDAARATDRPSPRPLASGPRRRSRGPTCPTALELAQSVATGRKRPPARVAPPADTRSSAAGAGGGTSPRTPLSKLATSPHLRLCPRGPRPDPPVHRPAARPHGGANVVPDPRQPRDLSHRPYRGRWSPPARPQPADVAGHECTGSAWHHIPRPRDHSNTRNRPFQTADGCRGTAHRRDMAALDTSCATPPPVII